MSTESQCCVNVIPWVGNDMFGFPKKKIVTKGEKYGVGLNFFCFLENDELYIDIVLFNVRLFVNFMYQSQVRQFRINSCHL